MQITQEIWSQISNGSQQAYAEVYRYFYRRFYNYGRKFTSDEAMVEDAIQEVLLDLWNKRHRLLHIEHTVTYFYTSFRYILFQKLKQQRRNAYDTDYSVEPEFAVDQLMVANETDVELKAQLQRALATLTARQREAIFLRFYEGLSYEEVADVLEITVKATYKIMARALQQLREAIPAGLFFLFLQQLLAAPGNG